MSFEYKIQSNSSFNYRLMKLKILGIIGLVLLIINQLMISKGDEFVQNQQIDFAHWFLLFGAIFTISFSYIFPKSIFNTIATIFTIIGIIAHIGMATIDFAIWSYGNDYDGMTDFIVQLRNKPSFWIPFITVSPSFLFVGLATQAWKFIRTHPIGSILTIGGSIMIGLSAFLFSNKFLIVLAHIIFSIGLILLAYRKDKEMGKNRMENIPF